LAVVDVIVDGYCSFFEAGSAASRSHKAAIGIAEATALQLKRFELCMIAKQFGGNYLKLNNKFADCLLVIELI